VNFKELASLRDNAGHLDKHRHSQSDQSYQIGLEQLAQARIGQLQNSDLLSQALAFFLQSLRLNRRDSRPAVAAAYIFILAGNARQANRYLRLVLAMHPNHSDALALQAQLSISAKTVPARANQDYESVYEQVSENLKALIQILHSEISFQPSLNSQDLLELEARYHYLDQSLRQLEAAVLRLDQELDASELFRDFRLIEQGCNRLLNVIARSHKLQALHSDIQHLIDDVAQTITYFANDMSLERVKEIELSLDGFLDRCDILADQLDLLESEGYLLDSLIEAYTCLTEQFGLLQDKLDEVVPLR
jgi:hypothetical protein